MNCPLSSVFLHYQTRLLIWREHVGESFIHPSPLCSLSDRAIALLFASPPYITTTPHPCSRIQAPTQTLPIRTGRRSHPTPLPAARPDNQRPGRSSHQMYPVAVYQWRNTMRRPMRYLSDRSSRVLHTFPPVNLMRREGPLVHPLPLTERNSSLLSFGRNSTAVLPLLSSCPLLQPTLSLHANLPTP